jgi:TolB protein
MAIAKGRMMMDSRLSGKQVAWVVIASVGLMLVLCAGLAAVLLIANLGNGRGATERTLDVVDRIALVSTDGNLYLVDRNGENLEHLAVGNEGTAVAYPTWSPDGRQVAFIAQRETDGGVESALYIVSTAGGDPTTLYASIEHPAFYLYWSPDSRYLSFLTQEDAGLALRLASADGGQDARVLGRGAPFYWSWSPDAQEMLMHVGGARRLSEEAYLAILSNQPESQPDVLDDAPANFQAPAWSPDGSRLLYASEDENGEQALYVRQREGGGVKKLINVSGFVEFNWSPDGQHIAYQQVDDPRIAPLGHTFVVNGDGSEGRQVSRDLAVAFFWSPDGQRLAILVPSLDEEEPSTHRGGLAAPLTQERQLLLRWWLMDMSGGELRPLVAFRPTQSFLFILPYFDQYAQSIRLWSPDSRYLVYSDQESAQQAGIWVADVEGQEAPRRLADGVLGVWSWQ